MPTYLMKFAEEPYVLHLLAGSQNITALDAAKALLDSGKHDVNEREPVDNLSPLHIAAAWDNIAMCQLLIHYGADLKSLDIDNRQPVDIACGRSRKFLRRLKKSKNDERRYFKSFLAFLFGRSEPEPSAVEKDQNNTRRSCPSVIVCPPSMRKVAPIPPVLKEPEAIEISTSKGIDTHKRPTLSTTSYETARNEVRRSSQDMLNNAFLTMDTTTASEYLECLDSVVEVPEEMTREELELREQLSNLSIECLKVRLKQKNCTVGPMNSKNRKLYEGKLVRLELNVTKQEDRSLNRYSEPLKRMIMDERAGTDKTKLMGDLEEYAIRNEYLQSNYRSDVSFFCYLLVDPTMIKATLCTFEQFISAIFYVGKGKHSRPLQHFIDANRCRPLIKNKTYQPTEKLKRILKLWDNGCGVISLPIQVNIHSAEALVREGCMIEAIGIDNLTNLRRGNFGGLPFIWTRRQMEALGASLLRKAHVIFKNERCRPVFESDIAM